MANTRKSEPKKSAAKTRSMKPAKDPGSREKQLTSLAVDLAEKQLRDGTASPSVITHFLKMASEREHIEREILREQAKLIEAKASSIESGKNTEKLLEEAINAMKAYSGD